MLPRALVVDTNPDWLESLNRAFGQTVDLARYVDFRDARQFLTAERPAFLITNLRLGPYNGLHLVHLVAANQLAVRCVVYSDAADAVLLREAQSLGAFCEIRARLIHALPAYFSRTLPAHDRRDVRQWDRRALFRGGRRAADLRMSPSPSL